MLCLAVSACQTTKRATVALRPDQTNPERFQCFPAGTRPKLGPEYQIDWSQVTTVEQARKEHERFIAILRSRENIVAGYVLNLEGQHFFCVNNMQWLRDYYRGLDQPHSGGTGAQARSKAKVRVVGPVTLPDATSALLEFRS